jgi:hypothetical protein
VIKRSCLSALVDHLSQASYQVWRMPSTGKPCHNCRKRRLRCDRSWPTCHKCAVSGQECLGYGKVFVWTQGIDSSGNLKPSPPGRRSTDAAHSTSSGTLHTAASYNPATSPASSHGNNGSPFFSNDSRHVSAEPGSATTAPLTDPLFQDLDRNSRYYLSYCEFASSYVIVELRP